MIRPPGTLRCDAVIADSYHDAMLVLQGSPCITRHDVSLVMMYSSKAMMYPLKGRCHTLQVPVPQLPVADDIANDDFDALCEAEESLEIAVQSDAGQAPFMIRPPGTLHDKATRHPS